MSFRRRLARIVFIFLILAAPSVAMSQGQVEGAAEARKAASAGRVRVTLRVTAADSGAGSAQAVRAATIAFAKRLGDIGVVGAEPIGGLPYVTAVVDGAQLDALLRDGSVSQVYVEEAGTTQLAESVPLTRAPTAWSAGGRGGGQTVAVIDTGVDTGHSFFGGRIVAEACFTSSSSFCPSGEGGGSGKGAPCPQSGCDHGTHVAGIAAGNGSTFSGVAPDATIIAIQAFSDGPSIWDSDLAQALEHVRLNLSSLHKIAAVNLSIGWSSRYTSGSCDGTYSPVTDAINGLKALGIATVVASGNNSFNNAITYPACITNAVAVGATTDSGAEIVTSFSNSATNVDLLAPGQWIYSSVPGGSFANFQGTSMAAPHVAGAFAVLRSKVPNKTVSEIEQALVTTGRSITDPDNGLSRPRIDVYGALLALSGGTPLPTWYAWVSRGGSLSSFPECELTSSGIGCWARSASNTLILNQSTNGDTWSGWTDLGGSLLGTPDCLVRGSRIDCFVITMANRLAQRTYNGTTWNPWTDLGGAVLAQPSCVPASSGLAVNCFATGTNKALWRRQFDGTAWKAWQSVGGSTNARPECVRRGTGIDCFIVNTSKNLQTRRLSGSTWSAWKQIGTSFGLAPQCLVSSNVMDCFAQSSSKQLLKGYYNGTSWAAWTNQGGDVFAQPNCNPLSTGFDCYWTTSTFKLVRRQRIGTTWQAAVDLGGAVQQKPVCLARNAGARLDCFARGTDNTLQQKSYY